MAAPARLGTPGVRNLESAPALASEPEVWTLVVDSNRANGTTCRRNNADTSGLSDHAWYEVDIPQGWIPAEIGMLACYVTEFHATPYLATSVTMTEHPPTVADYGGSDTTNFYDSPFFTPNYTNPQAALKTAFSYQDAGARVVMSHRGRGFPHMLNTAGEDFVEVQSWALREHDPGAMSTAEIVRSFVTVPTGVPIVQMYNPSGNTLRFEVRLMMSNAMPALVGQTNGGSVGHTECNPDYGFPAWRAVLQFKPIRALQYGNVSQAPSGQFV